MNWDSAADCMACQIQPPDNNKNNTTINSTKGNKPRRISAQKYEESTATVDTCRLLSHSQVTTDCAIVPLLLGLNVNRWVLRFRAGGRSDLLTFTGWLTYFWPITCQETFASWHMIGQK
jgi:hypothetical protein